MAQWDVQVGAAWLPAVRVEAAVWVEQRRGIRQPVVAGRNLGRENTLLVSSTPFSEQQCS